MSDVSATDFACVKCGYDLSGTAIGAVCPECSTPVSETLRRAQQQRPRWPVWIGCIAILFGAGGVIQEVSFALPFLYAALARGVSFGNFLMLTTVAVPAWLFVTGIGIVRRKRWSRNSARYWSVVKILLVAYYFATRMHGNLEDVLLWIAWLLALPVFLLLWFRPATVKSEVEQ